MARVGAIIVNWNSWELLTRCIDAIDQQSTPFSRVVVIDNASENQPDTLPFSEKHHLEYIRMQSNLGFAKANNVGIAALDDCEWIALINPDAFIAQDWLSTLIDASARYPTCAMFATQLVMANDHSRLDGLGDTYHISGLAWHGVASMVRRAQRTPTLAKLKYFHRAPLRPSTNSQRWLRSADSTKIFFATWKTWTSDFACASLVITAC